MNWKIISGYEKYEISDTGIVRNYLTKNEMVSHRNRDGYYRIKLRDSSGKRKAFYVHRLVYSTFCGEIPEGFEVHHINYDSSKNHLSNLALVTRRENVLWNNVVAREPKINICPICSETISPKAKKCQACHRLATRKAERPTKEELILLIKEKTWTDIGKSFGVSDNAVRKWARQYGII